MYQRPNCLHVHYILWAAMHVPRFKVYVLEDFLSGHGIIMMHWVWESLIQSLILFTRIIGFMKINKIARDCSVTFEDTGVIIKHVFSERITLKSIDYQYTRWYIACVIYIRPCICIPLWSLQKNDHVLKYSTNNGVSCEQCTDKKRILTLFSSCCVQVPVCLQLQWYHTLSSWLPGCSPSSLQ